MNLNFESKVFIVIIIISVVLLLISFIKQRFDLIVNFALRIVAGLLGIYILNIVLGNFSIDMTVGLNGLTALTVGLLGLPGFVLLYALSAYFSSMCI